MEAKLFIKSPGGFHVVQRVEQDAVVSGLACGIEHRLCKMPPQAKASKSLAHIQALHFRRIGIVHAIQRPQGATPRDTAIDHCQQQGATRAGIVAWQTCKLHVKLLEA